ncbi:MAG: aminotransferase class V-fold PLP-dependent enzyme, partial [Gaiellaceae bacterium]|nr:aminotransferase class V-fold PLP-dependent enzyme [Gaiellaceae bacterium]
MPAKSYLLSPGPTPVPPEVLEVGARQVLHHRGPEFRELLRRCVERLRAVCRTEGDVLLLTASGTGAFESAVANLLSPGDRVLAVTAGAFGDRWIAMAKAYGLDVHELRYAWGETPRAEDLRARL